MSNTPLEAYRDELLKIAADVGEPDDPFAAWEAIAALQAENERLRSVAATPTAPQPVAVKAKTSRWRIFEDAIHGYWGIELEQGTNDDDAILYSIRVHRDTIARIVDAHNAALSLPEVGMEGRLANALTMTGCENEEDLIDMANVGRSLMESIDFYVKSPSHLENWSPAESPVEIVGDLYDRLEESLVCHRQALDEAKAATAIIEQIEALFPNWRVYRDLVDCVDSTLPLIAPHGFRWLDRPITVTGDDYKYQGQLLCSFPKAPNGAVRYIVRDSNNRLFIHNAQQCGIEA
ncbi:hypothetical protein [Rhizobium sp.]|uniref:hypothetical protein n=1 Tax=Rhizobium sp. TaxID=391 RepID=UPI0034C6B3A5